MAEVKRKFIPKLYDECDMDSKKASIALMLTRGYELIGDINEEHYKKYDLRFKNNKTNHIIAVENEYRGNFKKIKEYFPTVHIPIRKKNSQCDFYFVWGENYSEVGIIRMSDINKFSDTPVDILCTLANRLYDSPEYTEKFIDVPKELVQFFKKDENGNWKKQKLKK